MIVKKELTVANRKKADIVAELRKKNFRPFPKVKKAKAAGEVEDVVEEEDEEGDTSANASTDYDYLLGMAIWSLTQEKVGSGDFPKSWVLMHACIDREIARASEREGG